MGAALEILRGAFSGEVNVTMILRVEERGRPTVLSVVSNDDEIEGVLNAATYMLNAAGSGGKETAH